LAATQVPAAIIHHTDCSSGLRADVDRLVPDPRISARITVSGHV
jgi:hypothetical protein